MNLPKDIVVKILNYNYDFNVLNIKINRYNYKYILYNDLYFRENFINIMNDGDGIDYDGAYYYYEYVQKIFNNEDYDENHYFLNILIEEYNEYLHEYNINYNNSFL